MYKYKTKGVCPPLITFDLDGDKVHNVRFTAGCDGNLKMMSKIVEGWTVDEIERMMAGNTCGYKNTSCADQLAKAVREAWRASDDLRK